jgi:hypothetical protein
MKTRVKRLLSFRVARLGLVGACVGLLLLVLFLGFGGGRGAQALEPTVPKPARVAEPQPALPLVAEGDVVSEDPPVTFSRSRTSSVPTLGAKSETWT